MKKTTFWFLTLLTLQYALIQNVSAAGNETPTITAQATKSSTEEQVRGKINDILTDNDEYVKNYNDGSGEVPEFFKSFQNNQDPRATIVACADSRFHTQAIDKTPENDIFLVRNIGNQLGTTEGSVVYGVRHLHTPLLMFIGHTSCGAIVAAADKSVMPKLEKSIQRELEPLANAIHKKPGKDTQENIEENIHNQVENALKEFADLIKEGKLRVVGALYDFQNLKNQGFGKLILLNIDGKKDEKTVKEFEEWARSAEASKTESTSAAQK